MFKDQNVGTESSIDIANLIHKDITFIVVVGTIHDFIWNYNRRISQSIVQSGFVRSLGFSLSYALHLHTPDGKVNMGISSFATRVGQYPSSLFVYSIKSIQHCQMIPNLLDACDSLSLLVTVILGNESSIHNGLYLEGRSMQPGIRDIRACSKRRASKHSETHKVSCARVQGVRTV